MHARSSQIETHADKSTLAWSPLKNKIKRKSEIDRSNPQQWSSIDQSTKQAERFYVPSQMHPWKAWMHVDDWSGASYLGQKRIKSRKLMRLKKETQHFPKKKSEARLRSCCNRLIVNSRLLLMSIWNIWREERARVFFQFWNEKLKDRVTRDIFVSFALRGGHI